MHREQHALLQLLQHAAFVAGHLLFYGLWAYVYVQPYEHLGARLAMAALGLATWPADLAQVSARGWTGLAYVSLFSMLIGFVFWYRGLALGGVAAVGQLQLLQPLMGLGLAAWLLGEPVG